MTVVALHARERGHETSKRGTARRVVARGVASLCLGARRASLSFASSSVVLPRVRGLRMASLRVASLRVAASVAVVGAVVGTAACGGIADMTDAGETGSFTVETPSLGAQTFEVDEADVRCSAIPNGGVVGDAPRTLLDVGLGDEAPLVRLVVSPYDEDVVAHASNRGGCEEVAQLCCFGGPCVEVTFRTSEVVGLGGGESCWVDVAYANGWARGDFDCMFDARASEPGARVHGSFRCAIQE